MTKQERDVLRRYATAALKDFPESWRCEGFDSFAGWQIGRAIGAPEAGRAYPVLTVAADEDGVADGIATDALAGMLAQLHPAAVLSLLDLADQAACQAINVVPGEYGEGVEVPCRKPATCMVEGVAACDDCAKFLRNP
jgi:hypothetical protein